MTDDRNERGPQDRSKINIDEEHEVQCWSRELGVTPEQLKAVVRAVGSGADAVRANLKASSKGNVSEPLTPSGDQRVAVEE